MAYDVAKDPHAGTLINFGTKSRAVVPSDTVDIDPYPKAVVLNSAGDICVLPIENADGVTQTFYGCPVGFVVPLRVRRVLLTGTTASAVTIDNK